MARLPTTARERVDALVIGAGPAGLMAAEMLAQSGRRVVIAEAKPSPARKFLMAGKSGLNLTHSEPFEAFMERYEEAAASLRPILEAFGPDAVRSWAGALSQPLFTGSSGRIYPIAMKASPLLRAWLTRLEAGGVTLRRGWRWTGWIDGAFEFAAPDAPVALVPAVTVLALGGASWRRLGSDGAWAPLLAERGIDLVPFEPANVGLRIDWSVPMRKHFGTPVKGVALRAADIVSRGEFVISAEGMEGSGVYGVSRAVREGAPLLLDLAPDLDVTTVTERLERPRGKTTVSAHLRRSLRLPPPKLALLHEFGRPLPEGHDLARLIKGLPIVHAGLRPMDEAISTAGGVPWAEVDECLMLKKLPGTFVAGEMLDWEARTGGYLLTACLATGRWSGEHAATWLA